MKRELDDDLNKIIEQAGQGNGDLSKEKARNVVNSLLQLFRLRLQDPYFISAYIPIKMAGDILAQEYPRTGSEIDKFLNELISNEDEAFGLLESWNVKTAEPATPKESHFMAKMCCSDEIIPKQDKRDLVLEFFNLS